MNHTERRDYWIGAAVTAAAALASVALLLSLEPMYAFFDFDIYRRAGDAVLAGTTPYEFEPLRHFQYAPAAAALFTGLSAMPRELALTLYYVGLAQAWWAVLWLVSRARGGSLALTLAVFVAVYAVPFWLEYRLGQVNVVPLLCVWGAASHLDANEGGGSGPRAALVPGLLLALALSFKLYVVVFLPVLLWRRRFDVLFATAGFSFVALFALGLAPGVDVADEAVRYVDQVRGTTAALVDHRYNASLHGVVRKLGGQGAATAATLVTVVAFLIAVARTEKHPWRWHGALALAAVPLLVPVAWSYWGLLGLPAVMLGTQMLGTQTLGATGSSPAMSMKRAAPLVALAALTASSQSDVAYYGGTVLASVLTVAMLGSVARVETSEPDRHRRRQPSR